MELDERVLHLVAKPEPRQLSRFVPLVPWRQVVHSPDKHFPLSQHSPELTSHHFNAHSVCVRRVHVFCGCCASCLPPTPIILSLYMLDSGGHRPDGVIQLCMSRNWQAVAILCGLREPHAHPPDVPQFSRYLWLQGRAVHIHSSSTICLLPAVYVVLPFHKDFSSPHRCFNLCT